jgi:RHH-type transcriptional regulator, rel operon repressor / antitoxin RelB
MFYLYCYTCTAYDGLRPIGVDKMLALRLPEEIEDRLDALARMTGRTKSFYAREAIIEHLEDLEDLYLSEQIVQKIRSSEEKVFSLDEVRKNLGLED